MFNSQLGFYRNLSDTCASLHDADDGYTIACASCTGTSRPERFVDGVVYIRRGDATLRTAHSVGRYEGRTCGGCDGYWRALSVVKVLSVISVHCAHNNTTFH